MLQQKTNYKEHSMKKIAAIFFVMILLTGVAYSGEAKWYKGNIHCHTSLSDGHTSPENVAKWYYSNGYNFIAITDHNKITSIKLSDQIKDFILIPGEELTIKYKEIRFHSNGINLKKAVEPVTGIDDKLELIQRNIDDLIKAGGTPQINHPHWRWMLETDLIMALKDVNLMEVYNANKDCNNYSAGGVPGMEEVWDALLSKGKVIYGTASDDAHYYEGVFKRSSSYPGSGWIMVKSEELNPDSITESIKKGDFYASTGVVLIDVKITEKEYEVFVEPHKYFKHTIAFIGKDGAVLAKVDGDNAKYEYIGDELYVRARVTSTSGQVAITKPYFIKRTSSKH